MITILMASYNGEKYIAEQIESILNQTEQGWKLVIQDDCSTDGTFKIAEKYVKKYPDRIFAVQRKTPSGSAQNNFFSMLCFANSEYTMFCDDDDVWLPNKIAITLLEMQKLEKLFGTETLLLVHTNLRVVDTNLRTISASMMCTQKLDPSRKDFNHLLIQNNITGCTMMVNRRLLELTVQQGLPQHAVMHDWWLALIASSLGQIGFVPEATILYRQHAGNLVGAKNIRSLHYNLKFLNGSGVKQSLSISYEQAAQFSDRFGSLLDEAQSQILKDFLSIPSCNKPERLRILLKRDFWKTGFFRKCGQIWFV